MSDAGADHQFSLAISHVAEFLDTGEVDDEVGLHQPQIEHRSERLASRHHLDGPAVVRNKLDRRVNVAGTGIVEIDRLHADTPSANSGLLALRISVAAWIASRTRRGVIGV